MIRDRLPEQFARLVSLFKTSAVDKAFVCARAIISSLYHAFAGVIFRKNRLLKNQKKPEKLSHRARLYKNLIAIEAIFRDDAKPVEYRHVTRTSPERHIVNEMLRSLPLNTCSTTPALFTPKALGISSFLRNSCLTSLSDIIACPAIF